MTEAQRIDALVRAVEDLPNAKFVRNDTEHDSRKAGEHLRLKMRESRGRCGSVQTSEAFLRAKLNELEKR